MRRRARELVALAAATAALACGSSESPNVVLVVLDTTRADHLTPYGYARDTSPHLADFADDAILFERAYSTSCWTLPAHASLFTGLLPVTHQATQETQFLSGGFETLAELLQGHGYTTALFSSNAWVGRRSNLLQGFEHVAEIWRRKDERAQHSNRAVRKWLGRLDGNRPFFLFVNFIEPHWTYAAPDDYQARFLDADVGSEERARANFNVTSWYLKRGGISDALLPIRAALYDAEIAYVDAALGELLEMLRERDLIETSLVVITADHGENLGENDHVAHSFALLDAALRVPLLIRPPGGARGPARRTDPVQLTDVFATIAAAAGLRPQDERITGRDLLRGPLPDDRPIVAEYYYPAQILQHFPPPVRRNPEALAAFRRRIRSLAVGPEKLVWGSDGRHELYDIAADAGETRNLAEEQPERVQRLADQLEALITRCASDEPPDVPATLPMDRATKENLRELGYLR